MNPRGLQFVTLISTLVAALSQVAVGLKATDQYLHLGSYRAGKSNLDLDYNLKSWGCGPAISPNRLGAVPAYALNWAQHQATTADLALDSSSYESVENEYLASWAGASAVAVEDWTAEEQSHIFLTESNVGDGSWDGKFNVGYAFHAQSKRFMRFGLTF